MSRFLLLVHLTIALIAVANASNYCGTSKLDASKWRIGCPDGRDSSVLRARAAAPMRNVPSEASLHFVQLSRFFTLDRTLPVPNAKK